MTDSEFTALLADASKSVVGDLFWEPDCDHGPAVEFRAEVAVRTGEPLWVKGSLNRAAGKLTYALIHRTHGCLYRLDLGQEHHNPTCEMVGDPHKHRWQSGLRDKVAYAPPDITATLDDPIGVWQQFCQEANLRHRGALAAPPSEQRSLL